MGAGDPIQLVGLSTGPARHFVHLAVLVADRPPDVLIPHVLGDGHGEDPVMPSGKKGRGLSSVELGRHDGVVLPHGNFNHLLPIPIPIPKGDGVRPVSIVVPALHDGGDGEAGGRIGLEGPAGLGLQGRGAG